MQLHLHGKWTANPQRQKLRLGMQRNAPFALSRQDGGNVPHRGVTPGLIQAHPRSPYTPARPARDLLSPLELDYRIRPRSHLKLEQSFIFWLTSSVKNLL